MNVLISGGAGFIGTMLTRKLLDDGHNVRVIDKMGFGYRKDFATICPEAKFTALECESHLLLQIMLEMVEHDGNFDVVIILHAESHVDRSIADARPFVESNITGTINLLDGLVTMNRMYDKPFPKVLLFSTDEVLGESKMAMQEEFTIGKDSMIFSELSPRNAYSASKASQELFFRSYNNTFGLSGIITRCCNVYGPGQMPEKFIPRSMTLLKDGKSLKLYGRGEESRQWIYVQDVCDVVSKLVIYLHEFNKNSVEVFHISGDDYLTNQELAERLCVLFDRPVESGIEYVSNRLGHDKSYKLDSIRIRERFGWCPLFTLESGLPLTKEYYERFSDGESLS